jgi:hypothetical protein
VLSLPEGWHIVSIPFKTHSQTETVEIILPRLTNKQIRRQTAFRVEFNLRYRVCHMNVPKPHLFNPRSLALFKIHFNRSIPVTLRPSQQSLSFSFSIKAVYAYLYVLHVPPISSSSFDHPNSISWVQILTPFTPVSCRSTNLATQNPILEHTQNTRCLLIMRDQFAKPCKTIANIMVLYIYCNADVLVSKQKDETIIHRTLSRTRF